MQGSTERETDENRSISDGFCGFKTHLTPRIRATEGERGDPRPRRHAVANPAKGEPCRRARPAGPGRPGGAEIADAAAPDSSQMTESRRRNRWLEQCRYSRQDAAMRRRGE